MNRIIVKPWRDLLYFCAKATPLDRKIWIFGAWFGKTYNDNSKYLFEYVSKNCPEVTAVWLTKNRAVLQFVRRRGFKAYLFYSPIGIYYAMRAGVAIFCCGYSVDLPGPCMSPKKTFVQLWHGVGPKKIGIMNKKVQVDPLAKSRSEYEGDKFERYNYFFTLSKLAKTKTMEVFGLTQDKEDRVIVSGYPRNDALLTPPVRMNTLMNLVAERQRAGLKVGIYLPTHRSEGRGGQTERVMEELKKINPILADQQIYLLVKMHHFHGKTALKGEFSHVHIITEAEIEWDLYPALAQTDFLVTDYSSVYVDYLLIDKPVFFLTYDLADYLKNDRGFYFDYNKVTPGPKIAQWSELVPTISKELRRDEYGQERERVRQMFHKYQDGKSTERVAETLMRTLRVD